MPSATGSPAKRSPEPCATASPAAGPPAAPASAWAVFENGDFTLLQGEVREYSSSPGIYWGSCPACGSLVTYRRDSRPDHQDITTATLDDPDEFPPTVEIWVAEKIGWETLDPDLPYKARSSLNE